MTEIVPNTLSKLGISRDSALWFWGKLSGAILFIASVGGEAASAQYGIPTKWIHVIQILAAWLMYFSAQQSTSKLYSEHAQEVISAAAKN